MPAMALDQKPSNSCFAAIGRTANPERCARERRSSVLSDAISEFIIGKIFLTVKISVPSVGGRPVCAPVVSDTIGGRHIGLPLRCLP